MSEPNNLAAKLAAAKERNADKPVKKASEIFASQKDLMATMGIYLPKTTIAALKRLAFEEETSVSAIIEELVGPRLKEGPRKKVTESQYPTLD
ncbi:ParB [Mycobacterium phage First]|uniref:Arc-like repressor n=1 Tax=Mycobacterium phage First TaxID=1245814 RepID=UPI0002C12FD3|nr:Arc-like repressor [Mycobacterium phage First]AFV51160.1 ParB [Mycobacterium phage First]